MTCATTMLQGSVKRKKTCIDLKPVTDTLALQKLVHSKKWEAAKVYCAYKRKGKTSLDAESTKNATCSVIDEVQLVKHCFLFR